MEDVACEFYHHLLFAPFYAHWQGAKVYMKCVFVYDIWYDVIYCLYK